MGYYFSLSRLIMQFNTGTVYLQCSNCGLKIAGFFSIFYFLLERAFYFDESDAKYFFLALIVPGSIRRYTATGYISKYTIMVTLREKNNN
jgi:hypothetical protein